MPPGPKSRISRSRRGMRRSQKKLSFHGWGQCANCGATVRPHYICLSCGYYKNRQILG
ncbi:MAG: 50S ribosomal protein L32 [Bdellovibrionales bacterium]|nr:50S ribosomal protein L32 [Bdellovibrionales bacterium]